MLTGQNGILNRAQEAKEKTDKAQEDENKKLQEYEDVINKYRDLPTGEETTPYLPNSTFSYKEGDLSTGLVIKDANNNEYVWVEVPTTLYSNATYNNKGANKPNGTDDYTNIELCLKAYTNDYADSSYSDKNSSFTNQYQKMLKSVYTNGGFWIGRYEAGYEIDESKGETVRYYGTDYDTEHPITQKVVIKKNAYPYNWVRRNQAQALAEKMNYDEVKSSLIYGIQWDLILKHIETKGAISKDKLTTDSTIIGNYSNNLWNITNSKARYSINNGESFTVGQKRKSKESALLLTTGADESFSLMNIYDIAGNVWEWTRGFYNTSTPSVRRGGSYGNIGSDTPAKYYSTTSAIGSDYYIGFRIGLWK